MQMAGAQGVAVLPRGEPGWRIPGHPPGLTVVILTGLWEIFALAGMRAILVFYLVKQLRFGDAYAIQVYSISTAAAFMMSLAGALLADRFLGTRRAVVIGGLTMAAGHMALLAPQLLFLALTLIVLGNGLLKPALVATIGGLYEIDDPRRDRAFVLYKAGCNTGAIFSPIVCGVLGETYGWTWALAACGIGMAIAAATFIGGAKYLPDMAAPTRSTASTASTVARPIRFYLPLALALLSCILFASAHGQQGATIALWTDRAVNRTIELGSWQYDFPAAWFQSLNPIVIVLATPIVNLLWMRATSLPVVAGQLRKMRFGALLLTSSFCLLALAGTGGSNLVSLLWPCAALVLLAVGEIYFDAIGQAFVIRHAGSRSLTTFVGLWFLVQALGFMAAGWLAEAWGVLAPSPFFMMMAGLSAASAVVVAIAGRVVRREVAS